MEKGSLAKLGSEPGVKLGVVEGRRKQKRRKLLIYLARPEGIEPDAR